MNHYLKCILKGVVVLLWMIVYWVLVGLIPDFFLEFYEEFHSELFYSSVVFSLLIYLALVSNYYVKCDFKSFTVILFLAFPYLCFLLVMIVTASNLPRIIDVFLSLVGVVLIYFIEIKNYTGRAKFVLYTIFSVFIFPAYYLMYDNAWYFTNKSNVCETQDLGNFNFKISDRSGASFNIADLRGSTVCIDMWASSCGNCIASMPEFEKLNQKFKGNNNYKIISLYCPIKEEQTFEWFKEYIDRKFDYDIEYYYIDYKSFNKLNIREFPEFLLISKSSKLIYRGQISYLPYVSDNIYNKLKSINENY